jgi:uncharacterized lipoprotein YmbA
MYPMAPEAVTASPDIMPSQIRIGVGPVTIREHLKRPQIVLRAAGSEIKLSEFHRWAESLEENTLQVLAQNLMLLLDSEDVYIFPWSNRLKVDYQIELNVYRFNVDQGQTAELNIRWTIFRVIDKSVAWNRRTTFTGAVKSDAYDDIVTAYSGLLEDFSRQLAEDIIALYQAAE